LVLLFVDPGGPRELLKHLAALCLRAVAGPRLERHPDRAATVERLASGDLDVIHAEELVDDLLLLPAGLRLPPLALSGSFVVERGLLALGLFVVLAIFLRQAVRIDGLAVHRDEAAVDAPGFRGRIHLVVLRLRALDP